MNHSRATHRTAQKTRATSIWYVRDHRITTKAAVNRAKEICDTIASNEGAGNDCDEHVLFRSLHVCAYRATSRLSGRCGSPKERAAWAERWRTVRDYLVERNMPLAHSMLARFGTRGRDRDDLLSEAMFALVQAVERFDPWRGFRFSTYACHAIRRAMMRSSKSTRRYRRLFPVQHNPSLECPQEASTAGSLCVARLQRTLHDNLGKLTELESEVLFKRFPIDQDLRRLTLQQVGKVVGLSKERVRQIQNRALSKLRAVLKADPILQ